MLIKSFCGRSDSALPNIQMQVQIRMKYTGRITVTLCILFAFFFEIIHYFLLEGRLYHPIILIAVIPFTYLGWWLGEQYDAVKYASIHDALTDSFNRRHLYHVFPSLAKKMRRKKRQLECYVIDINEFKIINDEAGHAAGDVILRNIAAILRQLSGKGDLVARWGGDEFLWIRRVSEKSGSESVEGKLTEQLEQLSMKVKKNITVSMGKSVFPDDGQTLEDLVYVADQNMYRSKQKAKGRNAIDLYAIKSRNMKRISSMGQE